jgi:cytidine deaminase
MSPTNVDRVACDALIRAAHDARQRAYAPYSGYTVGAALLTVSSRIVTGCNVENASYPAGICAERVALTKAVSEGERDFVALAVATSNGGAPCGICRQVLNEFAPDLLIFIADEQGNVEETTLDALLPSAFGPNDLR